MKASFPVTSGPSDRDEPRRGESSASPDHPEGDVGASGAAASGPFPREDTFQDWHYETQTPSIHYLATEEIYGRINPASARRFFERLWQVVDSPCFRSVWWGDDGNCIVIAERLFRVEVLGRTGPLQIFESESMRNFILQLNLYGFCRMESYSSVCTFIGELQAIAEAGPALGKLHFYYCPFFKRDYPNLLQKHLESIGERGGPDAPPVHPRKRQRPDDQGVEGAAEGSGAQNSEASSPMPSEPGAGTATQRDSAGPPPPKRLCLRSPTDTLEPAPAPPTASPEQVTPPAKESLPTSPGAPCTSTSAAKPGCWAGPWSCLAYVLGFTVGTVCAGISFCRSHAKGTAGPSSSPPSLPHLNLQTDTGEASNGAGPQQEFN